MKPIELSFLDLNLQSLLPMLVLIGGATFILLLGVFKKGGRGLFASLSIFTLAVSLFLCLNYSYDENGFFDMLLLDGLSRLSMAFMLLGALLFLPLALSKRSFSEYDLGEFYALFLYMMAGFSFMVSSNNLVVIFIGLETASLALYVLIALHKKEKSLEAAVKYFILGSLSAAFFGFGSMIFYLMTGSVDLGAIKTSILSAEDLSLFMLVTGFAFIAASIGFKLSLVPFHSWVPDVYQGSSAATAGFISVVPKVAGFVVALRFFAFLADMDNGIIASLLWILAVFTMTFGNVLALVQEDVKRMLAYSSISHAGFVLAALVMGSTAANANLFLYWFLFLFTNLGAFTLLWAVAKSNGSSVSYPFENFSGLVGSSPVFAIIGAIFMLSLAGIPPFALYWGKIFLISEAINTEHFYLGFIMILNSAIAVYYYLKLVVYMFLKPAQAHALAPQKANLPVKILLGAAAGFVLTLFLFIDDALAYATALLGASGF